MNHHALAVVRRLHALLPFVLSLPAAAAPTRPYTLSPESSFEYGCFDPCLCPILIVTPLEGRFSLSPLDSDSGELRYELSEIDWFADSYGTSVHVQGSGEYRIAHDVESRHRMTLLLKVNDGEAQAFDSGWVPGGDRFPSIEIAAASSGFFCWDSVFTLRAKVEVASASEPGAERFGFTSAWPNPFSSATTLQLALPSPDRVSVRIFDAAGRIVRTLAWSQSLDAGLHRLSWDGRRDDGSPAPAGVYVARLEGALGRHARLLIRTQD